MPTPTYTPLANITLANNTTGTVTFTGFSSTLYKDLVFVICAGNFSNPTLESVRFTFNNDTTNSYSNMWARGNGSSTTANNFFDSRITADLSPNSSNRSMNIINIMEFAATNKHKSVLVRNDNASSATNMLIARWTNDAAITTITFAPNGSAFTSGSTFALYGIAA
jgi:hypothetical protein